MHLFSHILTMCVQLNTQVLPKKMKYKTQFMQNKGIQFCFKLDKMKHISFLEFRLINCLSVKERVS